MQKYDVLVLPAVHCCISNNWGDSPAQMALSLVLIFSFPTPQKVLRLRGGMQIKVKTLTGKEIEFDIEPTVRYHALGHVLHVLLNANNTRKSLVNLGTAMKNRDQHL